MTVILFISVLLGSLSIEHTFAMGKPKPTSTYYGHIYNCSKAQADQLQVAIGLVKREVPEIAASIDPFISERQLSGDLANRFRAMKKRFNVILSRVDSMKIWCETNDEYTCGTKGAGAFYRSSTNDVHFCPRSFTLTDQQIGAKYAHELAHSDGAADIKEGYFGTQAPRDGTSLSNGKWVGWQDVADTYGYFWWEAMCIPGVDCPAGTIEPFRPGVFE